MHLKLKQLIILFVLLAGVISAQGPQGINYQGVARDQSGQAIVGSSISLQFELFQNTTLVYSEQHLGVSTGTTGVFSVVIGSKNNLQFKNVNWSAGNMSLKVSIDPAGGNQFIPVGNPQQLQSVPYSLYAESVASSYNGNILSIGNQTYVISSGTSTINGNGAGLATVNNSANNFTVNVPPPALSSSGNTITLTQGTVITTASIASTTYSNGAGISITSGSVITNAAPDVPVTITNAGNISVTGSYPNFSLSASATPNTTLIASGIASVSSTTTNSFMIGVQSPSFTSSGPTNISGTYPNYTINSAAAITPSIALTSNSAAGPSVTNTGSSFTINIPPPANTWSLGGNAGTSAAINYIGTNDAQDLVLKSNSSERVRIKSGGNVGIGTNAPSATLHVNGTTRLVDGTQGTDKVLTSDASGNASWQNSSRNTGFFATNPITASNQSVASYSATTIIFLQEDFDDGNNFAANSYTAPTQGVYSFHAAINFLGGSTTTGFKYLYFMKNGSSYKNTYCESSLVPTTAQISMVVKLNAGDVISLSVYQNSGTTVFIEFLPTYFSGYRVY